MCSRRKRRGNFKNAPRSSSSPSSFLCKEAFGSSTMLLEKEEEVVEVEGFRCVLCRPSERNQLSFWVL